MDVYGIYIYIELLMVYKPTKITRGVTTFWESNREIPGLTPLTWCSPLSMLPQLQLGWKTLLALAIEVARHLWFLGWTAKYWYIPCWAFTGRPFHCNRYLHFLHPTASPPSFASSKSAEIVLPSGLMKCMTAQCNHHNLSQHMSLFSNFVMFLEGGTPPVTFY